MTTLIKKIAAFLASRNAPTVSEQDHGLQFWREKILQTVFLYAVIFGLFIYIFGTIYALSTDLWYLGIIYTIIYLLLVFLFFSSKISYGTRALSILIVLFSLSIILGYILGPGGGAPIWMLTFSSAAGTLFGFRAAYISIFLNALLLLILGILATFELVPWALLMTNPLFVWITMSFILLFLNSATAIPLALILRGLESTLKREKFARDLIEKKNQYLNEANKTLLELSESLSDDIKTPLWKIRRNSEILLEKGFTPDSETFVESIHYESNRMIRLAKNTLLITKNTKDSIDRANVDLANLATSVAEEICEQFREANLFLKIEKPLIAYADVALITIFVENLILMAIENLSPEQRITITLGRRNLQGKRSFFTEFHYMNDGSISPDYDELISLTKLQKTNGISAVRRIIKLHDGFLFESIDKESNKFLLDFSFGEVPAAVRKQ